MEGAILPLEILEQQICQACGKYLSLGPVEITSTGQAVCGRLNCHRFVKAESKESLYNIIAEVCLFKCIYHYSGCQKILTFNEAKDHEKECKNIKFYNCPFCFYQTSGCELIYHFGNVHPSFTFEEITLEKILTYEGLHGHIDAILKMSDLELKQFLSDAPQVVQATCQNCKSKIAKRENIYFCKKHHFACQSCCRKKCIKCDSFHLWTKNCPLDTILLECEWKNCQEKRNIFQYLSHKQTCISRQYDCPCLNCHYTSCLDDIKRHWHVSPPLEEKNSIQVARNESSYWLPLLYKEIVYVTFEYDCDKLVGLVTLNEEGNILPVSFHVKIIYIDRFNQKFQLKYSPLFVQKSSQIKYFKVEIDKTVCGIVLEAF